MSKYPEHEKLGAVKNESQIIGEFLEWLLAEKLIICEEDKLIFSGKLLAKYFDIDLEKLEEERRRMLEEMRKVR